MKRTIVALATVIASSLTVGIVFSKSAVSQVSSSLLGYWGAGVGGTGADQVQFFSDSSYKHVMLVKGSGVHSYNIYGRTTTIGTFEVNGSTLITYPQSTVKQDAIGTVTAKSSYRQGVSNSYGAALQDGGQTLIIQGPQGVTRYTRINEIFAQ